MADSKWSQPPHVLFSALLANSRYNNYIYKQYKSEKLRLADNNVLGSVWATVFCFFFSSFCPFQHHQDENRATDSGPMAQYGDVHLQSAAEGQHFTSMSFTLIIYCESRAKKTYKNMKINMNDSKLLSYNWRPALVLHSDSFLTKQVAVLLIHARTHSSCQVGPTETSHRPCLVSSFGQTLCLWQPHQLHSEDKETGWEEVGASFYCWGAETKLKQDIMSQLGGIWQRSLNTTGDAIT